MQKKPVARRTTSTTETPRKTRTKVSTDKHVDIISLIKLDIKHKNETQKKLSLSIKENDVTVCTGSAGTGKTYISVFEALLLLKNNSDIYREIKLVKSITQLKNEDIGTLPGDAVEKMKFHMMSYLDAFYKLIGEELTTKLIDAGYIKFEVFGAIRGRSFSNAIILVDEFQNISHDNAKTFLTRFGDNTKIIILGDSGQIDIRNKNESSLERLSKRVQNKPINGVGVVEFSDADIVRHRLTSYFIDIFDDSDKPKPTNIPKVESTPKPKKDSLFGRGFDFFK
jgi:phosphate starvation-inducible PhoH-like protein